MSLILNGILNTVTASSGLEVIGNTLVTGILNTSSDLIVGGNMTVNGTTTTVNTITLDLKDINITLGKVTTPTDTTAIGGGLTLLGSTNKTIIWNNATTGWEFNQNVSVTGTLSATGNASSNNSISSLTSTATTAGTTVLTSLSAKQQYFTGTAIQTVTLPGVTTLLLGQSFLIDNESTGAVTINSSGSNLVVVVNPGESVKLTCILLTGTTAASWDVHYPVSTAALNNNSLPASVTTLAASSVVSGTGFSTYLASPPAIGGTSASTGAFTNLSSSGLTYVSINAAVSAAGTTQGTATAIVTQKNIITTCAAGAGVILSIPTTSGTEVYIDNDSANTLLVYPQTGATIDGGATNAPITIPVGSVIALLALSTSAWDAGISVNPVFSTVSVIGGITATSLAGVTIDTTTNKPVTAASLSGTTLPASLTTLATSGTIRENSKAIDSTAALTTFTVTTQYVYLTGTAGASFAVTLPVAGAGIDGQKCIIVSDVTRVSTTWASAGGTVSAGAPATLTAYTPVCLHYNHATTTWYISL